ncbi:MAG: hypothetical protein V3S21_10125, partial [Xanthomonadales bacterium]
VVSDLRYSATLGTEMWSAFVHDGVATDIGMVSYSEVLTQEQIDAIETYVISRALESGAALAE